LIPERAKIYSNSDQRIIRHIVAPEESKTRLDIVVAALVPGLTRSQVKRLADDGHISVDGRQGKPGDRVRPGQHLEVHLPAPVEAHAFPESIPLTILYEDSHLLVVDKPAGMVVHPGAGVRSGTLVNALLHHCQDLSGIGGVLRPGIVHRLDKSTSGLLVVAKNDGTYRALQAQFKEREVSKTYIAVVYGVPQSISGTIALPIGRHPVDRKRMSTRSRKGRMAITHWRVIRRFLHFSILEADLVTGRTHQVRVHLQGIGHPVVGDPEYGGRRRSKALMDPILHAHIESFSRQALHAHRLGFVHPATGSRMDFTSPLPPDMQELISILEERDVP
jgi:23S rRNA pseudouridine1911/1915/1917 synthase